MRESKMTFKDAQKIVNHYGAAMEAKADTGTLGGMAAPETLLPYSRDTIQNAIKVFMVALIRSRQYTDDIREPLKVAYMELSSFIPDDEARLVASGHKTVQAGTEIKDEDQFRKHIRDKGWKDSDSSIEILERITKESSRLLAEIDAFEVQQLRDFAADG